MKARIFLGALVLAAASGAQAQVTVFEADNGFDITTLIRNATAGLTVSKLTFNTLATHWSVNAHEPAKYGVPDTTILPVGRISNS